MLYHLLIVESPTKAKTISKYLGQDYKVLSSFGHIRDLPKSKLGVDLENHFAPTYTIPTKSKKAVTELKAAAKNADIVYLATDEDREGEAIAWHIMEALKLKPEHTRRITFHEITRSAVEEAVKHPRELDQNLIHAQQARRILDRLVGYELSPFLWQKIRYGLSAGRVQSVAMRLIVERERERRAFTIEEYWSVDAQFEKAGVTFDAKLTEVDGKKIDKLEIKTGADAKKLLDGLAGAPATVTAVEKKLVNKAPPTPLTTSTLQIDANTKLGFSSKQTMKLAQDLYETGRITYMRTDSMNLAEKFLDEAQTYIRSTFGDTYAQGARRFKTNKKGAQEAHEAIRPTDVTATPDTVRSTLEPRTWKLYNLIWSRTVASQLPAAQLNRTTVDISLSSTSPTSPIFANFRASGSSIAFPGFMRVYQSAKEKILPELAQADVLTTRDIVSNQHYTEPPARYSDATLVKSLEEFGIGRPSTYAPTISTIIDRGYVERDENKKLAPLDIAMIVNDVLVNHFPQVVDYEFTATMENTLDEIAEGKVQWVPTLEAFYGPFHQNLEIKTKELDRADIMPDRVLGNDPVTGLQIILKTGRFGGFVQVGEYTKEDKKAGKPKPKSASLLKGMNVESVTLEQALSCLSLPRDVGVTESGDPSTGLGPERIIAAVGRFGPYVKAGEIYASIKEPLDPLSIDETTARALLKESAELKQKMKTPIATFGNDPTSGGEILLKHGRFGPYLTDGTTNASLGKKRDPSEVTRESAIEILEKKRSLEAKKRKFKPTSKSKKT
jgi:DNA topoisomerase-1